LAASPQVEKVWSDRALQLKLLAFGLLVVGDLAWLLVPPLDQDTVIVIAIWSAIAVIAWFSPLIGALMFFLGALLLAVLWLGIFVLVSLYVEVAEKPPSHVGAWAVWTFVWWVALPMVAARLLVGSHQARRRHLTIK
jgi:predicted tellurium resistance membrane protein TerC